MIMELVTAIALVCSAGFHETENRRACEKRFYLCSTKSTRDLKKGAKDRLEKDGTVYYVPAVSPFAEDDFEKCYEKEIGINKK